jgi:hypothetical protein
MTGGYDEKPHLHIEEIRRSDGEICRIGSAGIVNYLGRSRANPIDAHGQSLEAPSLKYPQSALETARSSASARS